MGIISSIKSRLSQAKSRGEAIFSKEYTGGITVASGVKPPQIKFDGEFGDGLRLQSDLDCAYAEYSGVFFHRGEGTNGDTYVSIPVRVDDKLGFARSIDNDCDERGYTAMQYTEKNPYGYPAGLPRCSTATSACGCTKHSPGTARLRFHENGKVECVFSQRYVEPDAIDEYNCGPYVDAIVCGMHSVELSGHTLDHVRSMIDPEQVVYDAIQARGLTGIEAPEDIWDIKNLPASDAKQTSDLQLKADKKTHWYDEDAVSESKGRKASDQPLWQLEAKGANDRSNPFPDLDTNDGQDEPSLE